MILGLPTGSGGCSETDIGSGRERWVVIATGAEFVRQHVDPRPLSDAERATTRRHVQELHERLDGFAQERRTTAITLARSPKGRLMVLVSTSEPRSSKFPSRNACRRCRQMRERLGVTISDP